MKAWPCILVGCFAVSCAGASVRKNARMPAKGTAPVLVVSKGLDGEGNVRVYSSGLDETASITGLKLVPGHSQNTIRLEGRVENGPKQWSAITVGAVSSASTTPLAEYWRQGQYQVTTRPPEMDVDAYGRFLAVRDGNLALEFDLGMMHVASRRADTAILSLVASSARPVGRTFRLETTGGTFDISNVSGKRRIWSMGSLVDPKGIKPELRVVDLKKPQAHTFRSSLVGELTETATVVRIAPQAANSAGRLLVMGNAETKSIFGLPGGPWMSSAAFSASRRALISRFSERPLNSETVVTRREKLRSLLQLGVPQRGELFARDQGDHLIIEEWFLPTPSGTRGTMLVAKPRKQSGPMPALVYLCGHFPGGLRSPRVRALLREGVRAGFVTAAVGLMGFGRREGGGAAHIYAAHLTLLGESALGPMLEETEAGLETVLSLPEVDKKRVALSGISMGGTLAFLLSALRTEVAATAVMAGSPGFAAYAKPIGSDSEQHPWKFQAFGGLAALPSLIAPRKLSLIFAQNDGDHGVKSSAEVIQAAQTAYGKSPTHFSTIQGQGRHDQNRLARSDVIGTLKSWIKPEARADIPADTWLPPAIPSSTDFVGLGEIARKVEERAGSARRGLSVSHVVPSDFEGEAFRLGSTGPNSELWALPSKDKNLRTMLWRFQTEAPVAKVLMLDDGGRLSAAFAPILQRCGFEVSVAQPRTFGTGGSWPQAWHRKLLSLLSGSLARPLALELLNDLASAMKAVGQVDVVLGLGPESGALVLAGAVTPLFGDSHIVLGEAPAALSHRLKAGLAPYWTVYVPGLLQTTDLDLMAQKLSKEGRLTIANGGEALTSNTTRVTDPVSDRAAAVNKLLERYGLSKCMVELPVKMTSK